MQLSDYLDEKLVVFLRVKTQEEALHALVDALDKAGKLRNRDAFYQAILDREKLISTGIGMQVAIPHAKLAGYSDFFLAIGVTDKEGIDWDSLDGAPVRLIFMIGGPENRQTDYLKFLSQLTMAIKEEYRRKSLLMAKVPSDVIKLLTYGPTS